MPKIRKEVAPPAPQSPYLKRVHLRNVPPLRDVQVDFKPGLNIIIGKNGSGKTNFMKLLSELADLHRKKYRGVECELAIAGTTGELGGATGEIKIRFEEQFSTQREYRKPFPIRTSSAPSPLVEILTADSEVTESAVLADADMFLLGPFDYAIVPVWHGIPAHRMFIVDEGIELSFNNSGGMGLTNSAEIGWQQRSVLERALIDNMVPYDIGSPANRFVVIELSVIRAFIAQGINIHLARLNEYLPTYSSIQAVRLGEQFQVYRNTAKDEVIVKGLALEYCVDSDWLSFGALSDGTKRIFYLMGELLTASGVVGDAEQTGRKLVDTNKIILLEEPELGIHPQQLQLLLQLIREVSKEHQIILTTHSPQTLDMLSGQELDRVTICEYVPGKGTQMRKLSAAKKAKAKAYLRDQGFLSEFWRFSNLEDPD